MLLGILYESCHPTPVHHLPCGLTIFELQLASYSGVHNAVIGGPHKSFRVLTDQAGTCSALISHFVEGLAR